METKNATTAQATDQKIRLIDGEFTPNEAADIINALLDKKINFHKLQRLALWEGNVNANCSFPNSRIQELEMEKSAFKNFLKEAREEGAMLTIKGNLEIIKTR